MVDAAVPVVLAERQDVALAQPQRGVPLPGLGEPADLGELPVAVPRGQQAEHAAGLDRAELLGVAHRLRPGPGLLEDLPEPQQVGGGELAGLVEDQDVIGVYRHVPAGPVGVLDPAEELREVVGLGNALVGHDPGGVLA